MRFALLFLLLSACASEPEYTSPYTSSYSAPVGAYDDPAYATDTAPATLALSAAPCISYYTPAYPPPLGLVPCQGPLYSTIPGYTYPLYPGYAYQFYPGYGYPGYASPFFPAFGYAIYSARRIPYRAPGHVGHTFRHTPGHVYSGRRGKK